MDNAFYLLRQMEKVQGLAELYDYDCSFAYMPCLQAMKNGKPSNVERIVLKRIEMEVKLFEIIIETYGEVTASTINDFLSLTDEGQQKASEYIDLLMQKYKKE